MGLLCHHLGGWYVDPGSEWAIVARLLWEAIDVRERLVYIIIS